ncbi:MAG TPA: polyketide cyclase, partial [Rhodanobacteraceae bacterium]|nr:polyketide cyclase [Rhodanobacteraceae bacterium]
MTRLLEIITALIIVVILALIVGVALPSSGHVERSDTVSKDIRHVYDALDNFRTFPHYAVLRSYDPQLQYEQSDKWYGAGSSISWKSNDPKVSDGKLTIVSDDPGFAQVQEQGKATMVWDLQNDWYGTDKQFTISLQRTGRAQKLVDITWAYDVKYGWNLISR